MEKTASIIAQAYVWDGVVFQKVMKRGFKEVSNSQFTKWVGSKYPEVLTKYEELKEHLYRHFLRLADEFNQEVGEVYEDAVDFVIKEGYNKELFDVKANGTTTMKAGQTTLKQQLRLRLEKYRVDSGNTDISPAVLQDAQDVVIEQIKLEKLDDLKNKVKYDENIKADWNHLVNVMRLDKSHPEFGDMREFHVNALKHMVWQVKRKLYGLDVVWHLCVILYGKQGCGKSDFIKRFSEPLQDLYMLLDGENISDKFGADIFHNHFIGNIDELTKINDKSIEMVKQFITQSKTTSRQMFSQNHLETQQNMTLVASSNRPINKAIRDFTGMRRWWQADINRGHATMDFKGIEELNFLDYWKSIDENGEGFYSSDSKTMVAYQDTFKQISSIEEFVDQEGYLCDYDAETRELNLGDVFEEYKIFCRVCNYKLIRANEFRNSLKELGFQITPRRIGKKTKHFLRITANEFDEFE